MAYNYYNSYYGNGNYNSYTETFFNFVSDVFSGVMWNLQWSFAKEVAWFLASIVTALATQFYCFVIARDVLGRWFSRSQAQAPPAGPRGSPAPRPRPPRSGSHRSWHSALAPAAADDDEDTQQAVAIAAADDEDLIWLNLRPLNTTGSFDPATHMAEYALTVERLGVADAVLAQFDISLGSYYRYQDEHDINEECLKWTAWTGESCWTLTRSRSLSPVPHSPLGRHIAELKHMLEKRV